MKKMTLVIENFSSSNSEVSLPPSKEELYIMVEATPKNDQQVVRFTKAKRWVPNSTKSFSINVFLFEYIS